MKAKIFIPIYIIVAIFLASCDVTDPIYETAHPDKGKLTLTTDWTKRTVGIVIPPKYMVKVGDNTAELSGVTNTHPNLFAAGTYHINIYNVADKITVNGTTATVNATSGVADPLPGWMFSAKSDVTITADRSHTATVQMKQEVCQLDITLTITEGDPARIKSVSGTLAGIAAAWNIDTDSPVGDAASVAPAFTRTADKIAASMRLLGIVPTSKQELTLVVTFADDSQQTIIKDLSSLLTGFNTDQHITRTITANVETPIETSFTCTITDWVLGETRPGTAD